MQYNSDTNSQDIVTLSEKKCRANSTSFPIAEKTLYANEGSRIVWAWIFDVYGGWHYDDRNQTDLPEATATLTSGQQQYSLPTDSAALLGLSIKLNGSSTWQELVPITLEQIQDEAGSEAEFQRTNGSPMCYRPLSNGFKLYPPPNYTQTASLKAYFSRDIVTFLTTDTTKTPGFDSEFHEAIATYMALQYAKVNQLSNLKDLKTEWDGNEDESGRTGGFKKRIKGHYSRRFQQLFPARMTTRDAVQEFA